MSRAARITAWFAGRVPLVLAGSLLLPAAGCVRTGGGGGGSPSPKKTVYPSSTPVFTFNGDSAGDHFGAAVSDAGDVNRDGYADVIAGAPLDDDEGTDSGSARVLSGRNGTILYTFRGDTAGDTFGASVGGAGDVDRDGYPDLIVGAPLDDKTHLDAGSASVLSGRTGALLYRFDGDARNDRFGSAVAGAGDVNRDGYADVIVGAWLNDRNGTDAGQAVVFSGKDGRVLHVFYGTAAGDNLGYAVSGAGDVNKDGHDDVIVGAWQADTNGPNAGSATVFSGKDGRVLYRFRGDSEKDAFGAAVGRAGDVNRDGYPDLIVGARFDWKNRVPSGSAWVFSGADGRLLHLFTGESANDNFGVSVAGIGDVNRDGYDDVAVGAHGDDNRGQDAGSVTVFSGRDGKILFRNDGDAAGDEFGRAVSRAGDVNKDGYPDLIAGARWDDNHGPASGSARVVSGRALALSTDVHRLSLTAPGAQTLSLNTGPPHAGRLYWLLGTLAGTEPGIAFGPWVLPLNLDAYFFFTYLNPNTPPLARSQGRLDAAGLATAKFTMPPGLPAALAGLTLHHAFAVLSGPSAVEFTSNPVPLTFEP